MSRSKVLIVGLDHLAREVPAETLDMAPLVMAEHPSEPLRQITMLRDMYPALSLSDAVAILRYVRHRADAPASVPMKRVLDRLEELASRTDLSLAEDREKRDCEIALGMTSAGPNERAEAARRCEKTFSQRTQESI